MVSSLQGGFRIILNIMACIGEDLFSISLRLIGSATISLTFMSKGIEHAHIAPLYRNYAV